MHIRSARERSSISTSFLFTTTIGEAYGQFPGSAGEIMPCFKNLSISLSTNSLRENGKRLNFSLKGGVYAVFIACSTKVVCPRSSSSAAMASRQRSTTASKECFNSF